MIFSIRRLLHRRSTWILLLIIIAVRLAIFGTKDTDQTIPTAIQGYMKYFFIPQLSLFFTPLYCFWIFESGPLFFNAGFSLRAGSRIKLALEYGKHSLVAALS